MSLQQRRSAIDRSRPNFLLGLSAPPSKWRRSCLSVFPLTQDFLLQRTSVRRRRSEDDHLERLLRSKAPNNSGSCPTMERHDAFCLQTPTHPLLAAWTLTTIQIRLSRSMRCVVSLPDGSVSWPSLHSLWHVVCVVCVFRGWSPKSASHYYTLHYTSQSFSNDPFTITPKVVDMLAIQKSILDFGRSPSFVDNVQFDG